jgi:hypothetical protein
MFTPLRAARPRTASPCLLSWTPLSFFPFLPLHVSGTLLPYTPLPRGRVAQLASISLLALLLPRSYHLTSLPVPGLHRHAQSRQAAAARVLPGDRKEERHGRGVGQVSAAVVAPTQELPGPGGPGGGGLHRRSGGEGERGGGCFIYRHACCPVKPCRAVPCRVESGRRRPGA